MENQPQAKPQAKRQRLVGVVSSAAGDKTIRVVIESTFKHPTYGKFLRRQSKIAAHDENNAAARGDVVEITTCRRISKTKSYRLLRIVRKATDLAGEAAADGRAGP